MDNKENYFIKLNKIEWEVSKKQNLSYISWANAWDMVKREYPDATYITYENSEWFPFWSSDYWIDVKVWVTVGWIEHIVRLPVMDWANKAMKDKTYTYKTKYWEKTCEAATQFDINKAIQRAFTKAIAMHWIWLYVFRWEDLPDIDWELELTNCKTLDELKDVFIKSTQTKELIALKDELKTKLK